MNALPRMTPEDRGPEWAEFYAACARAEVALDVFERATVTDLHAERHDQTPPEVV